MSRGAIAHYSSLNLDACTVQLGNWNPFVSSPAPISSPPDPSSLPSDHACIREIIRDDRPPDELLECRLRTSSPELEERAAGALHLGVDRSLVKCSFKQIVGRSIGLERSGLSYHLAAQFQSQTWDLSAHAKDVEMGGDSGPFDDVRDICGVCEGGGEGSGNNRQGLSTSNCCGKVSSSMTILLPSLSGWSERHKQLSRALARGLWRWREGSRATKRRRKARSSCSGSGRSSDSRRTGYGTRMYVSDPPTVGASAGRATCSDIPMPGTDSSGELFFHGEGSGIGWDPELSSSGDVVSHRRDGIDSYNAWFATETQSLESGYSSEPGYRGDGELGYGDDGVPDEQDEEEKSPLQLSPWRDNATKVLRSNGKPENISGPETLDEDCTCERTALSDLKMQHRLRRRRQDGRLFNGQKSRHL